jgi:hypothetical protein
MPRPPREPGDLDDVLGQVSDALDELEVVDGADREALLGSLREVLGALGGLPLRGVEVHTVFAEEPASERPSVRLVDGGLASDAPAAAGRRPELRLAEEDCGDPDTHSEGPDPDLGLPLPAEVAAKVRVLTLGRIEDDVGEPLGHIRLDPPEGGEIGQVLFVGSRARTYRVRCLTGALTVHASRTALATLAPGQTMDVEARRIRVSAAAPAEGRYLRLPG